MTENKTRINESIQKLESHLLEHGWQIEKVTKRKWNITLGSDTLSVKVKAHRNGDQADYQQINEETGEDVKPRVSNELSWKGVEAAKRFLTRRGYTVHTYDFSCKHGTVDVVAEDEDGTIVFVFVKVRVAEMPEENLGGDARKRMEGIAACFLSSFGGEFENRQIRFDNISMLVMSEDRALIRHHINCLGEMD